MPKPRVKKLPKPKFKLSTNRVRRSKPKEDFNQATFRVMQEVIRRSES